MMKRRAFENVFDRRGRDKNEIWLKPLKLLIHGLAA
jgi:hypothetical protein